MNHTGFKISLESLCKQRVIVAMRNVNPGYYGTGTGTGTRSYGFSTSITSVQQDPDVPMVYSGMLVDVMDDYLVLRDVRGIHNIKAHRNVDGDVSIPYDVIESVGKEQGDNKWATKKMRSMGFSCLYRNYRHRK